MQGEPTSTKDPHVPPRLGKTRCENQDFNKVRGVDGHSAAVSAS